MIVLIIAHLVEYSDYYVYVFTAGCIGGVWHLSKEPKEKVR